MREMVWIIGVGAGVVVLVLFIFGARAMQADIQEREVDFVVHHHNKSLDAMKDAGLAHPDAQPITRQDLERRRRETLARLNEVGGPQGLAERAYRENRGLPPDPRRVPQASAPPEQAGTDSQVTILFATLGGLVLLTLASLGVAAWMVSRGGRAAAPDEHDPPLPPVS